MHLWGRKGESPAVIKGKARVGRITKQLLRTIPSKHIAVIHHLDLDEVAATGLLEAKVKAVINTQPTMSGKYPLIGPLILIRSGIPIFEVPEQYFSLFKDEQEIIIDGDYVYTESQAFPLQPFTEECWRQLNHKAEQNLSGELNEFIKNTLHYAGQEINFVTQPLPIPAIKCLIRGRHVVVVVRGSGYKKDLQALRDYIEDYRPVLIGVDGGADALMEFGYQPDMIVGDMDSISDHALRSGAEIIVHAYPDGRAPGMERVKTLGLAANCLAAPGTSEDIAMLIAYEKHAEWIVTVGTHSHMIDFLEKGRKGMGSTLLVRMKIGSKLMDAKGVSKLYNRPMKWRNLWVLPVAGFFPLLMLGVIHPGLKQFFDVLWVYVKLRMN